MPGALRLRTEAAPTVEEAAAAASVSRTTAYRDFPNQKSLLVAAHPETEAVSLVPDDAGADWPKAKFVDSPSPYAAPSGSLTDVAGLSRDDASELMSWSAEAMLRRALADG